MINEDRPTFQVLTCESCDDTITMPLDRCIKGELVDPRTFEFAGICQCICHKGTTQLTRVPMPGSPSGYVVREIHFHEALLQDR